MTAWARQNLERYRNLGDLLQAGPLEQIEGLGPQRHITLTRHGDSDLCIGWRPTMTVEQIREMTKKVQALWDS